MPAPAGHRDLVVGLADAWIQRSRRDVDGRGLLIEPRAPIELQRLPGIESLLPLELGKPGGITGGGERERRHPPGVLMLPVAVRRRAREHRQDDVRPESPDDANGVLEYRIRRPESLRFLERAGESVVEGASEKLRGAVDVPRGQQLLRADQ